MGNEHWSKIMKSPEMLEKRMRGLALYRAQGGKAGRLHMQTTGLSKRELRVQRYIAANKAEKAMRIMEEKNIWKADNDVSAKAMDFAIQVVSMPEGNVEAKLKAAKIILDFTQSKPVVKNETTLKNAEDFLNQVLSEEGDGPNF
jgi:hypothetical protein